MGQVSGNIKFSNETKGKVNWEIRAKVARNMDKPKVEMEGITGEYRPNPDTKVFFQGSRGELDRAAGLGTMEDVEVFYKDEYRMTSKTMSFDMNKSFVYTVAPVFFEGKKFSMNGVGLIANVNRQVINIMRDVRGTIDRDKGGKIRFSSERFSYRAKEYTYIFIGQVVAKGEDMNLICDKVFVRSNEENAPERIDAVGNVKILSKGTIAKSERAVYYFKEEKVILKGSPRIVNDKVQMEGTTVIYDLKTEKFSAEKPKLIIEQRQKP